MTASVTSNDRITRGRHRVGAAIASDPQSAGAQGAIPGRFPPRYPHKPRGDCSGRAAASDGASPDDLARVSATAATSPSTRVIAARSTGCRSLTVASGKGCGVVDLKAGEGRIEHFSARHEDDIESGWRLLFPEQLAGKTLGPVPDNRGPELSGRRNTESTPIAAVWRHKQSHEPAPQPQAVFIRALKLGTPPDPLVSRKALRHRALVVFIARQRQSDVFCPSCDVVSARCGRSSSTFAHGSRESCCGDACWAETCAFPLPL